MTDLSFGWRYLIGLVVTGPVGFGFWLLLDYLMPPNGCSILDAMSGGNCAATLPVASQLHALAGVLIGLLVTYVILRWLNARQKARKESTKPKDWK